MDRKIAPICRLCLGTGWLCEEHPNKPWDHDVDCEGVGFACECNANAQVPHADVFVDHDQAEGLMR